MINVVCAKLFFYAMFYNALKLPRLKIEIADVLCFIIIHKPHKGGHLCSDREEDMAF